MLEKDIEKYLVKKIREQNGLCYKFVSPGNAGVPDRLILLPAGRIYFVELKAPGKKSRANQLLQQHRLIEKGAAVKVIDSKTGVDDFIQAIKEG